MGYKEFWWYYKAVLVSIVASLSDMIIMYILTKENKLNAKIIVGLSSFVGLVIQFFGQKLWTFKNKTNSSNELLRQVLLFFGLELFIIVCVMFTYEKLYDPIANKIKKSVENKSETKATKLLFNRINGEIELTTIFKIALKSGITFVTFNVISYPLWRYVIFT
jgi:putative flippase GtrA